MQRAISLLAIVLGPIAGADAATYTVTTLADSGAGSLRAAITSANLPGPDQIEFSVSGTIVLSSALPVLTDPDTSILGQTAPDTMPGPDVVLDAAGATDGIAIDGTSGCLVQGLRLENAALAGIDLVNGAASNQIGGAGPGEGNHMTKNGIGLRMSELGTQANVAHGNEIYDNIVHGVALVLGASSNQIGGAGANEGNWIYGNVVLGVWIESPLGAGLPCDMNVIEGTAIGCDWSGVAPLPNGNSGVLIAGDCTGNVLRTNLVNLNLGHGLEITTGGNIAEANNTFSGNGGNGVRIGPGLQASFNIVMQNLIGLDPAGAVPLPNDLEGLVIIDGGIGNVVRENVISGNIGDGVHLYGNDPQMNLIVDNLIGLDISGTMALPNGGHGVHLSSVASDNEIRQNVISGNAGDGVRVEHCGSEDNRILGNVIGLALDGIGVLPNGGSGVRIAASRNRVGGPGMDEGNLLSANANRGIEVRRTSCAPDDLLTEETIIQGNTIGLDAAGNPAGNGGAGIWLAAGAYRTLVGGDPAVSGVANVIQRNGGAGVSVGQGGAVDVPVGNQILSNSITQNIGLGIRLLAGGNDVLISPIVTSVSGGVIQGDNTLFGSGYSTRVQVFYGSDDEGEVFVGRTTVASTDATWSVTGSVPSGVNVTATNTSMAPFGNPEQTSGFSGPIPTAVATPACFGDGSGTDCPCMNFGGPGEGCQNSSLAGGLLEATGSASISLADLTFLTSNLMPGQPGIVFQGNTLLAGGAGVPFGAGLRCVGMNVVRIQVIFPDAMGDASTSIDIGLKGMVAPGDQRHYQCWYRDPGGLVCPGTSFNLTQALTLDWQS